MTINVLSATPGYIVEFELGSEEMYLNQMVEEMRGHCRILEKRGPQFADTLHAAKHRCFKEDIGEFKTRVAVFVHRDHAKLFAYKMEGLGCIIEFS